jgi:flagella basal body P-ring formation protein FlgA
MGHAMSCINIDEKVSSSIQDIIKKSYPNVIFSTLTISPLGNDIPFDCDSVQYELPERVSIENDLIVKFDLFKNDVFFKRITKIFRFNGTADVLKTEKVVERGDHVSIQSYYLDQVSIDNITNHTLSRIRHSNMQYRNYVSADQIIESWMVEQKPDVKKGQKVKAVVKKANITLTLDGRVLENGYIGDSIKLKLNDKIIIGNVYDEKTVIINRI